MLTNQVNFDSLDYKLLFFYAQGYHSTEFAVPPKDPTPDYNLTQATEENGFTNVQFDRIPTTKGDDKDVQFGVKPCLH